MNHAIQRLATAIQVSAWLALTVSNLGGTINALAERELFPLGQPPDRSDFKKVLPLHAEAWQLQGS